MEHPANMNQQDAQQVVAACCSAFRFARSSAEAVAAAAVKDDRHRWWPCSPEDARAESAACDSAFGSDGAAFGWSSMHASGAFGGALPGLGSAAARSSDFWMSRIVSGR